MPIGWRTGAYHLYWIVWYEIKNPVMDKNIFWNASLEWFLSCNNCFVNNAGYLYNFQTKEFYDLNYGQETSDGPTRFGGMLFAEEL